MLGRVTLSTLLAVALATLGSASASTLGGAVPASLLTRDQASTATTPTVLACDDFSRAAPTGANLSSRPPQLPATCGTTTWTTPTGTWTVSAGQATTAGTTPNSTAAINVGRGDLVRAQATVVGANVATRSAGVLIGQANNGNTYLAGVLVGAAEVQLRYFDGKSSSVLATATTTVGGTTTVSISRSGTSVSVGVDGSTPLTFVLSSAQATALSGNRAGLYWGSGSSGAPGFTHFSVTTP
jgi:hypothetical protein